MAEVLQKGFSSISDLLHDHLGFSNEDFINNGERRKFINNFGRLRSKHDEQLWALSEMEKSKLILNQPSLPMTKKHNELILLSFLHSIGYDVSFAFIHAVNMAQQGELMAKRSGYLLCSLFFDFSHQFALLLINTILKDLQNPNVINECAALIASSQLVARNNFPTILPYAVKKLNQRVAISRKKALQCLYTFVLKDPSLIVHVKPHLPNSLKDSDPGVVWVAMEIYMLAAKQEHDSLRHLVTPVRKMIETIVEGRLSEAYDYHGNPSPWLLMTLVRFISLLCRGCRRSTDETSFIFLKLLKQIKTNHRVGFAIIYEVIKCISKLDLISEELFHQSHECIQLFLTSCSFYLKLSGIRLLTMLIPKKPSSALQFQSAILEVLRCSDPSLQHAAVDLLFVIANQSNKEFVCQKILEQTMMMGNLETKKLGFQNLLDLLLRFSNDTLWFISSVFKIFDQANKDNINIDFESSIWLKFLNDRDDETKKKAVELAEKNLKYHEGGTSKKTHFSLQLLTKLEKFTKSSPGDLVLMLLNILPMVVENPKMSSEVSLLIGRVLPRMTNNDNDALISVKDLLDFQGFIHPHIKLDLIELQILLSKIQANSYFESNKNIEKTKDVHTVESVAKSSDALINMETYTLQYLERGGMPYVRPELEGVLPLPNQKLGEESGGCWESEVQDLNNFEDSTRKEEGLTFLRNNSETVWSKSGYKQESSELNHKQNDMTMQEEEFSCKLFQGFYSK